MNKFQILVLRALYILVRDAYEKQWGPLGVDTKRVRKQHTEELLNAMRSEFS